MFGYQNKDWFFYTDRNFLETKLFYKNDKKDKEYQQMVYYPEYLQTQTLNQQRTFQKKLSFKFLYWSLFNKEKFHNTNDYTIAVARVFDINSNVLVLTTTCYLLRRIFRRIDTPFIEMMLEDKWITLPKIKNAIVGGIFVYGFYKSFDSVISNMYLYDLALEYNKYIIPDTLIQPNVDQLTQSKISEYEQKTKKN